MPGPTPSPPHGQTSDGPERVDAPPAPRVGRFAPSPTGPLHFGSLVAAVGSYLQARSRGGRWLVRMEDLDPPREVPGAAADILRTLEGFGFQWDGEVLYQSTRGEAYQAALERLVASGAAFPCACSRTEIAQRQRVRGGPAVYPGTCRGGLPPGRRPRAWRVCVAGARIRFEDRVFGLQTQDLEREVGDFPVRRADGLFAYQLAVVVDDAVQGVTEVVRGSDLLASTARQILLQRLLGAPTPGYAHLPVVTTAGAEKLSKQTGASAVRPDDAVGPLHRALRFLGQQPPAELRRVSRAELWAWAVGNWRLERVPRRAGIPAAEVADRP